MTKNPNRKPWVINQNGSDAVEVLIYEEIGAFGVTAKQFADDIAAFGDVTQIDVRINSVGGSVPAGLAIHKTLARHPAHIRTFNDGVALSMGSVILMAGDEIIVSESSVVMIHDPSTMSGGNADQLRKDADMLDKMRDTIVSIYANRSGRDEETILRMMNEETWLSAEEAVELGFADRVEGAAVAIAASAEQQAPEHIPTRLRDKVLAVVDPDRVAADVEPVAEEPPTMATATRNEPQAATLEQLEALDGADDKFVIGQLKAHATLQDATASLLEVVNARCVSLSAERDQLIAKVEELTEKVEAKVTGTSNAPGIDTPVATNTVDDRSSPSDPADGDPFGGDPVAFTKQKTREHKAAYPQMGPAERTKAIYDQNPGLREALAGN